MAVFFRVIVSYILTLLIMTVAFIALLRTGILTDVPLFFRGVGFLVVLSVALFILGLILRAMRDPFDRGSVETLFSAVVLAFAVNFAFFVIVPVTIDRSVTTFMLASMETKAGEAGAFSKSDIETIMEDNYLRAFDAVGRRLEEQIVSGNIADDGAGGYNLTQQGTDFLEFARSVADVYGIPKTYIDFRDGAAAN
jgi:Zn-dependent protease with chaperone function